MKSRFDAASQTVIVELSIEEAFNRGYSCLPEHVRLREQCRREFATMTPEQRRAWFVNHRNSLESSILDDDVAKRLG